MQSILSEYLGDSREGSRAELRVTLRAQHGEKHKTQTFGVQIPALPLLSV
jgi:hypothetical protein